MKYNLWKFTGLLLLEAECDSVCSVMYFLLSLPLSIVVLFMC